MKIEEYFKNFCTRASETALENLEEHSKHVKDLAAQFYNELIRVNFFNKKDKELLEKNVNVLLLASALHDIGSFSKRHKPHNKTGAKIILENKIDGLDDTQNLIAANIVRFHRGKIPKRGKQKIFQKLDKNGQKTAKIFSSIVRIADALDCGHCSFCKNIHLTYDNLFRTLTITLNSNIILNVGFYEVFGKKKKFFEKIFKVRLSAKTQ